MKRGVVVLLAALILGVGAVENLHALRCGSALVEKGDRKVEVLKKCGEPVSIDVWEEVRRLPGLHYGVPRRGLEQVVVEEWTYNFGPQRFLQIYRFENGQVTDMQYGNYGF